MKHIVYIICLIGSLSCAQLNEEAPSDLIPPDKMARILVELHGIEMRVSRMGLKTYDSSKVAYDYLQINKLEEFDVDTSQYRRSYEFYAANPDQFLRIYDKVESLNESLNE